jgi:hypothetical protein
LEVPEATAVLGKSGVLPAVATINHPHAFQTHKLNIVFLAMKLTAKNSANLAQFADKSRFHHHRGHREALVFWETSAKRSADANALSMVCHAAGLKDLLRYLKPIPPENTDVMSRMLKIERLKTAHARVQPVLDASARKRYDR